MPDIPNNGRQLKKGDPLGSRIAAARLAAKKRGETYPSRKVDSYHQHPHVWYGGACYHAETLERLMPVNALATAPVALPDHYTLNGDDRLPGENATSYARYLAYRDLGPQRTLRRTGELVGAFHSNLSRTAARWRWAERATAYDNHVEVEARRSAQAILDDRMAEEVRRRDSYLKNEWEVVEKGFGILHEMLKYPVVVQKSEKVSADGKTIITIWEPGKWTYAAMAQLIDTLAKVGRLHTGLSTSNTAAKIETLGKNETDRPQMSADEEEMHVYASKKAEEAYFAACEEWRAARAAPERLLVAVDAR